MDCRSWSRDTKKYKLESVNEVSVADLGDEWVLLHVGTGDYYTINEVGVKIFQHARKEVVIEELIDDLFDQYDVGREKLEKDARKFIQEMCQFGLISISKIE